MCFSCIFRVLVDFSEFFSNMVDMSKFQLAYSLVFSAVFQVSSFSAAELCAFR